MKNFITAFIVDDDHSARNILQKYLEIDGKVEVISSLESASEAIQALKESVPEVIFLDINMPNEDGIWFARQIKELGYDIPIVFTSAYTNYALLAYPLKPIDFLVKPFGLDEIFDVVNKVERYIIEKSQLELQKSQVIIPKKLKLRTVSGYIFISPKNILYISVGRGKTNIHMVTGEKEHVLITLLDIYSELKKFGFLKLNRSLVVNLKYVVNVDRKARSCDLICNNEKYSFVVSIPVLRHLGNLKSLKL